MQNDDERESGVLVQGVDSLFGGIDDIVADHLQFFRESLCEVLSHAAISDHARPKESGDDGREMCLHCRRRIRVVVAVREIRQDVRRVVHMEVPAWESLPYAGDSTTPNNHHGKTSVQCKAHLGVGAGIVRPIPGEIMSLPRLAIGQ